MFKENKRKARNMMRNLSRVLDRSIESISMKKNKRDMRRGKSYLTKSIADLYG